MKSLEYYMNLPYTIIIKQSSDGIYEASIAELDGCLSHGDTIGEAIKMLLDAKRCWIETNLEAGDVIPEPDQQYFEAVVQLYDLHLVNQTHQGTSPVPVIT